MRTLDNLIYDAIRANEALMQATAGRIKDVCYEVSQDQDDNVPLPYIVVTDDGGDSQPETKDTMWYSNEEAATVSVIISAKSPNEVKSLRRLCRRAIADYMASDAVTNDELPDLTGIRREGLQWDWMKPCYWDALHYQCTQRIDDDEPLND